MDIVPKIFPAMSLWPGTPAAATAAASPWSSTAQWVARNRRGFYTLMATIFHCLPQWLMDKVPNHTFQTLLTAAWTRACNHCCWTLWGTLMENCDLLFSCSAARTRRRELPCCLTASAAGHYCQTQVTQAVTTTPWTRPRSRTSTATIAHLCRRQVATPLYRCTNRTGCQKTSFSLKASVETQGCTIRGPGQASNSIMEKMKLWQKRTCAWEVTFFSAVGWCKFRIDFFIFIYFCVNEEHFKGINWNGNILWVRMEFCCILTRCPEMWQTGPFSLNCVAVGKKNIWKECENDADGRTETPLLRPNCSILKLIVHVCIWQSFSDVFQFAVKSIIFIYNAYCVNVYFFKCELTKTQLWCADFCFALFIALVWVLSTVYSIYTIYVSHMTNTAIAAVHFCSRKGL